MSTSDLVQQTMQLLASIDWQLNTCYAQGVDCTQLLVAKNALMQHLDNVKKDLNYQMEAYNYYGITPDLEALASLIEELGYDEVKQLYGDVLDELLLEVGGM